MKSRKLTLGLLMGFEGLIVTYSEYEMRCGETPADLHMVAFRLAFFFSSGFRWRDDRDEISRQEAGGLSTGYLLSATSAGILMRWKPDSSPAHGYTAKTGRAGERWLALVCGLGMSTVNLRASSAGASSDFQPTVCLLSLLQKFSVDIDIFSARNTSFSIVRPQHRQ